MKRFLTAFLLLSGFILQAQVLRGKITTTSGEGIPYATITIENTYTGTTANEDGRYEVSLKKTGAQTVVFQSIGFKTKKVTVVPGDLPPSLDIVLEDETYELKSVTVSNSEDPAYAIIRQAIAAREANGQKAGRFEADFYSKGMYRVKNMPSKIMGIKVDVENQALDSTGSGIVYLAETVSHITFEQPDRLKERVIATKVSGNDNGFSFNTARENNFNFYDSYLEMDMGDVPIDMVSPIASSALGYYKYKLEGSFFDENGHQVNKIKVIPRRDKEPVFEGYIYIVEDSWCIYAIDLIIKGYRMQMPIIKELNLKQNFSYNETNGIWAKNSQTADFTASMFGITFNGAFTYVYSNYVFHEKFEPGTFGKEIAVIEEGYNKKDTVFWNEKRPIPLSEDEVADYIKKDSLQNAKKTIISTITTNKNRFKILDILGGYNYTKQDSLKSFTFNYDGVLDKPSYNTVQGWSLNSGFGFNFWNKEKKRSFAASAKFNYGIAEDRLRVTGQFSKSIKKVGTFNFSGGAKVEQFNPEAIKPLINSVSTLIFKDNYMKLYDKTFAAVSYSRSIANKLMLSGNVEYLRRRPLYNNADWVLIKNDHDYTSNDPLNPYDYTSAPFEKHSLGKATISGTLIFEKEYITYPTGKIPMWGGNYPDISFKYEQGFAGTDGKYNFGHLSAKAAYGFSLDNKGEFVFSVKGGTFFHSDGIAFMDYKHFNGNQTHVGLSGQYTDVFNLLPYYALSTNKSYMETHIEHNFKGYVMNKIPLLNWLQWNLVLGYHNATTTDYKPYHEFTAGFSNIGIGAFRFLRVDYVRAYQGGFATDGVIFGLGFFL